MGFDFNNYNRNSKNNVGYSIKIITKRRVEFNFIFQFMINEINLSLKSFRKSHLD